MPRFEVSVTTVIAFDADSRLDAQDMVERGEIPSDHERVAAFTSRVERVASDEELAQERKARNKSWADRK